MAMRIQDQSTTHVGHVRSVNEDSHASLAQQAVWVVADGMGGHANGQFASRAIAEAVAGIVAPAGLDAACAAVAQAIHQANVAIFDKATELGGQMGSTVVALIVREPEFAVLWAGDSRAYLFRAGQLIRLTRDHTQVEMMLERGLLSPQEAEDHPMKHVLARAVGVQDTLELDAIRDLIAPDDLFVLCSDGLHGVLGEDDIAALLHEHGPAAGPPLIAACLERGAPDNVTVILVAALAPTLLRLNGAGQ